MKKFQLNLFINSQQQNKLNYVTCILIDYVLREFCKIMSHSKLLFIRWLNNRKFIFLSRQCLFLFNSVVHTVAEGAQGTWKKKWTWKQRWMKTWKPKTVYVATWWKNNMNYRLNSFKIWCYVLGLKSGHQLWLMSIFQCLLLLQTGWNQKVTFDFIHHKFQPKTGISHALN